jgi:hypothetical protein
VDVYIHTFLTSTLAGGEWSASRLGRFTRGKERPVPIRLGGPQSRSGRREEEKILDPTGTRTPDPSVVQPVASHYYRKKIPNIEAWGVTS